MEKLFSMQRTTTTFSNLFVLGTAFVSIGRGNYTITVAGYDWFGLDLADESVANESSDYSNNSEFGRIVILISMATLPVRFLLMLQVSVYSSFMTRNKAVAHKSASRLAAPNISGFSYLTPTLGSSYSPGMLLAIFLTSFVLLLFYAFNNKRAHADTLMLVYTFFVFQSLLGILLHLVHNNFKFGFGKKSFIYNRLSCSLFGIIVEKLLYECNSYDAEIEKFLIDIGKSSSKYDVTGGSYKGENLEEPFDNLLTPGLDSKEIIVYANEKSAIRVFDATSQSELEDVFKLTSKIRYSTSETNKRTNLAVGTLSWALVVSSVLNEVLGPGRWPGVDGIDKSLIWLGVIALLARYIDFAFPIAFCVYPLGGKAEPRREICKWKDRAGALWVVLSDDEGIIRMRREPEHKQSS